VSARLAELESELAALGRPGLALSGLHAILESGRRAREWDAAHPREAETYRRLVAEFDVEQRRASALEAERLKAERILRASAAKLERSGVGERALASAVDAQDTEALLAVKRWLADASKTWLVLCGARGTGKSVAATWAVRHAITTGSSAAFRRASELAKLSGFEAGAAELEHLKRVDLLVLDDVGTESLTDWARAQFHELVDTRHESYGRTILTGNLRWAGTGGLEARLGERIADRIAQAGMLVQVNGDSMRRKKP
jgi:DNA replication protein DnaC